MKQQPGISFEETILFSELFLVLLVCWTGTMAGLGWNVSPGILSLHPRPDIRGEGKANLDAVWTLIHTLTSADGKSQGIFYLAEDFCLGIRARELGVEQGCWWEFAGRERERIFLTFKHEVHWELHWTVQPFRWKRSLVLNQIINRITIIE